jgi:predicted AlkP superfamily phosphohydrolase/phosphomutase
LDGKVQPNLLLRQWGYLGVDPSRQTQTRVRQLLLRRLRRKKGKFAANYGIEHDLAIDWPTTRAFVAHAGMCGFLYVNLKGRQGTGTVDPRDYETLRTELVEKLLALRVRDPHGNDIAPFEAVHKPERLYNCERDQYGWLPDLMLVPRPGLAVVRKVRGNAPVVWSSYRKLEGTHRMEGILMAAGPNIRHTTGLQAGIVDIAPTLLAALGLKIPSDMEGRVIEALFDRPPQIEFEAAVAAATDSAKSDIYSEREQAVLTQRLADLGYLE